MGGSDKVKGFAPRVITIPGYHIHPQFDLVHLRHLIDVRRHKKAQFTLNLAPMVDMFSVLVIFLIMNFSSNGDAFFVSQPIALPKATKGKAMGSNPLVSIVGDKVIFNINSDAYSGPKNVEEANNGEVPRLRELLRSYKSFEERISGADKKFEGRVNLQADVNAPVENVKKVMRVLIDEGWTGINFVVDPSTK